MTRYKYIYIGTLIVSLILCIASGRGILLIPFIFLICAGLISAVYLWLVSSNISIEFKAKEKCIVNKTIQVQIKMSVASRLPIGKIKVRVRFYNSLFDYATGQELIMQPGNKKTTEFELPYTPNDCGHVKITVQDAVCFDLFGIVCKKIPKTPDMQIVVYPEVFDFMIRKSRTPKSSESSDQYDSSRKGQDVTEVFDLRDYQIGDSLRSVHWKLSSKIDQLVVREFANPTRYRTMLFYDGSFYKNAVTEQEHSLMNAVLSMVAALSKNMMEENIPHSFITMANGNIDKTQVESRDGYFVMLDKLMHGKIADAGDSQLKNMIETGAFEDYSKAVAVTCNLNDENLRNVAERVNLTVLEITESGEQYVEQQGNMEIIRIPLNKLKERVHTIEI